MKPIEQKGGVDGARRYTHPAFATISVSRGHCTPPAHLFGSPIRQDDFVRISISDAVMDRRHHEDHAYSGEPIVEIMLSPAQWAEFMLSVGVGGGVPATIIRRDRMPVPAIDMPSSASRHKEEMDDFGDKVIDRFAEVVDALEAEINGGSVSRKRLRDIARDARLAVEHVRPNARFMTDQLQRAADKIIESAQAVINTRLERASHKLGQAGEPTTLLGSAKEAGKDG